MSFQHCYSYVDIFPWCLVLSFMALHHNGNNIIPVWYLFFQVYISNNGQELTGRIAYMHYRKVLVFFFAFLIVIVELCHLNYHTNFDSIQHTQHP